MMRRFIFKEIINRIEEPRRFIQVLLGPRQVGKTTLALQVAEALNLPTHYASADLVGLQDLSWLREHWDIARTRTKKEGLFIIDEVHKIPNWTSHIKSLWDEDTRKQKNLKVILLGSSPWLMQKGLSESLAGRFEVVPITHWSYGEMRDLFEITLDQFIYFGGYPGASAFIDEKDASRFTSYINDSLIETTLSRDILLMTQINKPALLRRLFQLACSYSGQILSYNKILGQLDEAGNTTTLAHYLDLLAGVGLIEGLQKFSLQKVRKRGSSPKFMVFNTALMSAQADLSFRGAKKDKEFWGRLMESAVGAHLLNKIRGTQIELTYWREGNYEVDFVLQKGRSLTAIEVKSGNDKTSLGMNQFIKQFNPSKILFIGKENLEEFFQTPLLNFFSDGR